MENGIKIMNLEGSDILKNNLEGLYIKKIYNGVFTDSLLSNKLQSMGLKVSRNDTTSDIITVQFSYGYTPNKSATTKKIIELNESIEVYRNKISELNKKKKGISKRSDKRPILDTIKELKQYIRDTKADIKQLKEESKKSNMNGDAIREKLYEEGFKLEFYKKDRKTKEYKLDKTIEYQFWFRTPSKSRVGDCMFINKKLYEKITKWQCMGLKLPKDEEAKVVEFNAYMSLTSSNIIDAIELNPSEILVVNDIDSFFETNCALVKTRKNGECYVECKKHKIKNTLFDGMMLLDDEFFKEKYNSNSFMLLRQHFFKACGFRSFIKNFMIDTFGDEYFTATVKDRYGNNVKVSSIRAITTENAMKWEKFKDLGASFEYWKQKVEEDNCEFGLCKVDHESKFGKLQRMSYQHINTLDIENQSEMDALAETTIKHIEEMKDDSDKYIDYLQSTATEFNANDMMVDLYIHNREFIKSSFAKNYKKKDISKYVNTVRGGKLLNNANNLTVVGNPYILLLHAIGQVPVDKNNVLDENFIDSTLPTANEGEDQYISVYTTRFKEGEYLAAFRNPHNSPNNIGYHKNFKHDLMKKYFRFNDSIMAVNMIQTEEQDLKNGEDEDSDFNYVTNNPIAVQSAKKSFRKFPCIVNEIEPSPRKYINNMQSLANIDNALAQGKNDIGLSSNVAQLAMSWYWKDRTEELADIVCIMSVLAQCSIDNSKRQYSVNLKEEIDRIRKLECMNITTTNGKGNIVKAKPKFWKYVSSRVKEDSLIWCDCPMNLLQDSLDKIKNGSKNKDTIDIVEFLVKIDGKAKYEQINKVEKIVKGLDDLTKEFYDLVHKGIVDKGDENWKSKIQLAQRGAVEEIKKIKINQKTMSVLVKKAFTDKKNKKYARKILSLLYKTHKETFISVFKMGEIENIKYLGTA